MHIKAIVAYMFLVQYFINFTLVAYVGLRVKHMIDRCAPGSLELTLCESLVCVFVCPHLRLFITSGMM